MQSIGDVLWEVVFIFYLEWVVLLIGGWLCFHKSLCNPAVGEPPWNPLWPFWSPGTSSMFCSNKLHIQIVLTAGSLQEWAEQQNSLNLLCAARSDPLKIPSQTSQCQMLIEDSTDTSEDHLSFRCNHLSDLIIFLKYNLYRRQRKSKDSRWVRMFFSVWVCCLVLGEGFVVAFRSRAFSMRWTLCRPRTEFPVLFPDW